jgi:hypothetical protein
MERNGPAPLPEYGRRFFGADATFTRIGQGQIGGKASGLRTIRDEILAPFEAAAFPMFDVVVPNLTVLTTELFDSILSRNHLDLDELAALPDDRIAHRMQQVDLPAEFVGDLLGIVDKVHTPLAVRSSSLLEDALHHPMAGVYGTKMTPNNQPDVDARFRRLIEAIKYVYASTFFRQARSYLHSIHQPLESEKMAIIVQEVVGRRWSDRYYPDISGVARSYNYYPSGRSEPEDGVVSLALGLGKQIVDGGVSWTYCPRYPKAPAPFNNIGDLLKNTQTEFWSVHMGSPPPPDPIRETEHLKHLSLTAAEQDGSIDALVSTYDARSDRLRAGVGGRGPRVLNFAPILEMDLLPLNDLVRHLLKLAEEALGAPVEIEFALTLARRPDAKARFGFLQVRPMMVTNAQVDLPEEQLEGDDVLLASKKVLGNGVHDRIQDVVYLKPRSFEARHTPRIAQDLERINLRLLQDGIPYMLIGFGRWGSSDPWLGVPVEWGQVCGTRVIVEATLPQMNPDLSQGSHFFHNLIGCQVLYLSVPHQGPHRIDWEWLDRQEAVSETEFVRHVRLAAPLRVAVDGCHGRGVVKHAGQTHGTGGIRQDG